MSEIGLHLKELQRVKVQVVSYCLGRPVSHLPSELKALKPSIELQAFDVLQLLQDLLYLRCSVQMLWLTAAASKESCWCALEALGRPDLLDPVLETCRPRATTRNRKIYDPSHGLFVWSPNLESSHDSVVVCPVYAAYQVSLPTSRPRKASQHWEIPKIRGPNTDPQNSRDLLVRSLKKWTPQFRDTARMSGAALRPQDPGGHRAPAHR